MRLFFNAAQWPATKKAFSDAEKLVLQHFRLDERDLRNIKYEVKTLAYLNKQEIKEGAFAHLCKYAYAKAEEAVDHAENSFDFYRICLQDHTILDAVRRSNSFIKLSPLMLYIAVHELIQVPRFSNGEIDFHAATEEKEREEVIVHHLTRSALQPVKGHGMEIIFDCFNHDYENFDLCH